MEGRPKANADLINYFGFALVGGFWAEREEFEGAYSSAWHGNIKCCTGFMLESII